MPTLDEYLAANRERFENNLCELLRIPSVSAEPPHRGDMANAAQWVADRLRRLQFDVELVPTAGNPLIVAQSPHVPGAPTALVYGHYDVQPVEPLDLWTSPPFEPTRRDGNLYARGATDDKGQLLTHVFSVEACLETEGRLPVNLKYLIEGEEEVGSGALWPYLKENAERLACDCVVISDGGQFAPGLPAITYGLRGIVGFELKLTGPNRDVHSGSFGGSVTNPANALSQMLAALVDRRGKVRVPGFYRDVKPLSKKERAQLAALPFDEAHYFQQIGVVGTTGEAGYTTLERRWARPTFDICGLTSGYQGVGAKTIIPSTASAKITFRLVPNQDPKKIGESLRAMLESICPPGIRMELMDQHGSPGVVISLKSPYVAAAARAIEHAFGRPPVYTREGGSIPVVLGFRDSLGADVLLMGWGQDDDNAHSPNEKFSLADFHRGIRASARLWQELSRVKRRAKAKG